MQGKGRRRLAPAPVLMAAGVRVEDTASSPARTHSSPLLRARSCEVGRKETPSGSRSKAEKKHFGAAARGLREGTAGGARGSRRGAAAPGRLLSPPARAGQRPGRGVLRAQPLAWPLTPGGGNSQNIKRIKAPEGLATRAQLFFPSRPFVLFLVTSFSWQQNGGGGNLQEKAYSARDTSRKTMWSAGAGNGLEARVRVG